MRPLAPTDHDVLLEATLANVNWNVDLVTLRDIIADAALSRYTDFTPERGDFGFLVHSSEQWIGVVWVTFFDIDEPGYAFVADGVPELALCVRKGFRRQGIGRLLTARAFRHAVALDLPGLSLCVQDGNSARVLYERMGFVDVSRSGGAATMFADRAALAAFAAAPPA
jgi:GNAT superfamily N-acetyltransferase